MDNIFLVSLPTKKPETKRWVGLLNKIFARLGYKLALQPNPRVDMSTIEQRINMFHLLESTIACGVEGEVAEFGCFTGQTAMLFQKVIVNHNKSKTVFLFDSFETDFGLQRDVESELKNNFSHAMLPMPKIIKGRFEQTVPEQLPSKLSFVHIDCGVGTDPLIHKNQVLHLLKHIYPIMSTGAICMLMDYCDRDRGHTGRDFNPGVKIACDEFFTNKPEKVYALYGNQYSHGYFRKI